MSSTNSTNLNPVIKLNPTTIANINSAQAQKTREANQRRSITVQNQIQNNAISDVSSGTYVGSSSNTDNTPIELATNRNNVLTNLTTSPNINNATLTSQNTSTTSLPTVLGNGVSQVITNAFSPILQQLFVILCSFVCSPLCIILLIILLFVIFRK